MSATEDVVLRQLPLLSASPDVRLEVEGLSKDTESINENDEAMLSMSNNVQNIIRSMKENPSLVKQFSDFWMELSVEIKALIAVILFLPLFVAGIVVHMWILLTVALVSGFILAAINFLLEDFNALDTQKEGALRQCMEVFFSSLGEVIGELNGLTNNIDSSISEYHVENENLAEALSGLKLQVGKLSEENAKLTEDIHLVDEIANNLKNKERHLGLDLAEQVQFAENNKVALEAATIAYQKVKEELSLAIQSMHSQQSKLTKNLSALGQLKENLNNSVSSSANLAIQNEELRSKFIEDIQQLNNKVGENFNKLSTRMQEAETKMLITRAESDSTASELEKLETNLNALVLKLSTATQKLTQVMKEVDPRSKSLYSQQLGLFNSPDNLSQPDPTPRQQASL